MLAIKSQNAAEENQNSVHDNVKLNSANMITLALFITRGLVTKTTLFVFTPNDSRFTVHTVYHLHSIRKLRRENVSNVLKANGYTKTFLCNCQMPVITSSTPNNREPATGFAVIPYI